MQRVQRGVGELWEALVGWMLYQCSSSECQVLGIRSHLPWTCFACRVLATSRSPYHKEAKAMGVEYFQVGLNSIRGTSTSMLCVGRCQGVWAFIHRQGLEQRQCNLWVLFAACLCYLWPFAHICGDLALPATLPPSSSHAFLPHTLPTSYPSCLLSFLPPPLPPSSPSSLFPSSQDVIDFCEEHPDVVILCSSIFSITSLPQTLSLTLPLTLLLSFLLPFPGRG